MGIKRMARSKDGGRKDNGLQDGSRGRVGHMRVIRAGKSQFITSLLNGGPPLLFHLPVEHTIANRSYWDEKSEIL